MRLARMGRAEAALGRVDRVLAKLGDAPEVGQREDVARALRRKAYALFELARTTRPTPPLDDLLARFGDDSESELREHIAHALYTTKAWALEKAGSARRCEQGPVRARRSLRNRSVARGAAFSIREARPSCGIPLGGDALRRIFESFQRSVAHLRGTDLLTRPEATPARQLPTI
jgi:hypothetical protein